MRTASGCQRTSATRSSGSTCQLSSRWERIRSCRSWRRCRCSASVRDDDLASETLVERFVEWLRRGSQAELACEAPVSRNPPMALLEWWVTTRPERAMRAGATHPPYAHYKP